jgi:hypothetical protein
MPKQPQVNTEALVDMYRIQHLTVRAIGRLVGMSGPAVWKRLQADGVSASEGTWCQVACFACGAPVRVTRARWRNTRKVHCSEVCYFKTIANPAYNPNRQGQRLARRAVSRVFALKASHVVHHVDTNNSNNRLDNLWVFACQADHMSFHRGGDAVPIWKGEVKSIPVVETDGSVRSLPVVE